MFEVLYNGIGSPQAPGLNAYEKSVFLTKAQNEIVKNYFNPRSKGNNTQEGFDGNQKRQIDFSMLTTVYTQQAENMKDMSGELQTQGALQASEESQTQGDVQGAEQLPSATASDFGTPMFDLRENSKSIKLPTDLMMAINEVVEVNRKNMEKPVLLQVIPIKFDEYSRLMSKPYKRPLKYQAWRLLNSDTSNKADIVIGPTDSLKRYTLRYIRRPKPIIVGNLDGLSIEGEEDICDCELDKILHEEILQRAVELAKAAWTSTGQDNLQAIMQTGQRSE